MAAVCLQTWCSYCRPTSCVKALNTDRTDNDKRRQRQQCSCHWHDWVSESQIQCSQFILQFNYV